ncbi:MAG: hypothetical protein FWE21_03435 [Defluviitaleaceae bacterium]|nr:hypothetical protein [Defluviitaleaceae bacterium]
MEYCLCLRKDDNNLLHIIQADELAKPFYSGFRTIKRADDKEEAFEAVANMVSKFCKTFWKKGQNPDFTRFKAWAWQVRDEE